MRKVRIGFIERLKMILRVFVEIDRDFLRHAFFSIRLPFPTIAARIHTAIYPSVTLPITFNKPIHLPPDCTA